MHSEGGCGQGPREASNQPGVGSRAPRSGGGGKLRSSVSGAKTRGKEQHKLTQEAGPGELREHSRCG